MSPVSFRPAPPRRDDADELERARAQEVPSPGATSPCARVAEQVAVAIGGALPWALEVHVDECAACRALLAEATRLGDAIRHAADRYAHAGDFEARVLAKLSSEAPPTGS